MIHSARAVWGWLVAAAVLCSLSGFSVAQELLETPRPPEPLLERCPYAEKVREMTRNFIDNFDPKDNSYMFEQVEGCLNVYQAERAYDMQVYKYNEYQMSLDPETGLPRVSDQPAVNSALIWMRVAGQSLSVFIVFGIGYRLGGAISI
jgi:hypothetical protein